MKSALKRMWSRFSSWYCTGSNRLAEERTDPWIFRE
jgi:hypothetical protein